MIEDQQPETPQPKVEWAKPEFRQLAAGSAEQSSGDNVDNINAPS